MKKVFQWTWIGMMLVIFILGAAIISFQEWVWEDRK